MPSEKASRKYERSDRNNRRDRTSRDRPHSTEQYNRRPASPPPQVNYSESDTTLTSSLVTDSESELEAGEIKSKKPAQSSSVATSHPPPPATVVESRNGRCYRKRVRSSSESSADESLTKPKSRRRHSRRSGSLKNVSEKTSRREGPSDKRGGNSSQGRRKRSKSRERRSPRKDRKDEKKR